MPVLLLIDTAIDQAQIGLSVDGRLLAEKKHLLRQDHATFLHPAIQQILSDQHLSIRQLDGIAVSAGPGSYTGIRIGMATASGLAYALRCPLMALSTLELIAREMIQTYPEADFYAPLIDARRMEVFTAVYDKQGHPQLSPQPHILTDESFAPFLQKAVVVFGGNGAAKWRQRCSNSRAIWHNTISNLLTMNELALQHWKNQNFIQAHQATPLYLKDFQPGR